MHRTFYLVTTYLTTSSVSNFLAASMSSNVTDTAASEDTFLNCVAVPAYSDRPAIFTFICFF
jgi:hypothetical protein